MHNSTRNHPFFGSCVAPILQWRDGATGTPTADPWQAGPAVRRLIVAVAVLMVTASGIGCASVRPQVSPGHVGFILASAGDVLSTNRALSSGATEQNPLLGGNPSTSKLLAMKVGGWAALRTIENAVEGEIGRPLHWWENLLFWAIPTGVSVWATQHNLYVARNRR